MKGNADGRWTQGQGPLNATHDTDLMEEEEKRQVDEGAQNIKRGPRHRLMNEVEEEGKR